AAGAVGQPLMVLGRLAGLEVFGAARARHADLVASFGATPIDYEREDFVEAMEGGADVVFDGIAEDGFRRSYRAVRRGGFLSAYGLSAAVDADMSLLRTALWYLRPFVWNLIPNGKRSGFYSITSRRKKHPDEFREDLGALFGLLERGEIHPRVEERITLAEVPEAHRRIEAGGLAGKLIVVPA
ncbi:MAG: zinc-binding dehydrogenase, partial [Sandaracinaceae bacterium]